MISGQPGVHRLSRPLSCSLTSSELSRCFHAIQSTSSSALTSSMTRAFVIMRSFHLSIGTRYTALLHHAHVTRSSASRFQDDDLATSTYPCRHFGFRSIKLRVRSPLRAHTLLLVKIHGASLTPSPYFSARETHWIRSAACSSPIHSHLQSISSRHIENPEAVSLHPEARFRLVLILLFFQPECDHNSSARCYCILSGARHRIAAHEDRADSAPLCPTVIICFGFRLLCLNATIYFDFSSVQSIFALHERDLSRPALLSVSSTVLYTSSRHLSFDIFLDLCSSQSRAPCSLPLRAI
jgi:hypothetical protein